METPLDRNKREGSKVWPRAASCDKYSSLRIPWVGLDAGEVVPVEGGFWGAALNLAARLCNLAGPGEILTNEAVIHLANRVEGRAISPRGRQHSTVLPPPVSVVSVQVVFTLGYLGYKLEQYAKLIEASQPAEAPPACPTSSSIRVQGRCDKPAFTQRAYDCRMA